MIDKEAIKWFCDSGGVIITEMSEKGNLTMTFWLNRVSSICTTFNSAISEGKLFSINVIPAICVLREKIENG